MSLALSCRGDLFSPISGSCLKRNSRNSCWHGLSALHQQSVEKTCTMSRDFPALNGRNCEAIFVPHRLSQCEKYPDSPQLVRSSILVHRKPVRRCQMTHEWAVDIHGTYAWYLRHKEAHLLQTIIVFFPLVSTNCETNSVHENCRAWWLLLRPDRQRP